MMRVLWAALAVGLFVSSLAQGAGAATAAPAVADYGRLPSIDNVSLSPSGARIAMVSVVGEKRKLVVGRVGGGALLTANLGDVKVRSIGWAGEDHLLLTLTETSDLSVDFAVRKAELIGVLVVAVPSGKTFSVFAGQRGVSNLVQGRYGVAEINGHWYGFFGGITNGLTADQKPILEHTYADLYRVDLDTGGVQRVVVGSELGDGWVVGPDGEVIAHGAYDEKHGEWRVLTGAFGGRVLASGHDPYSSPSLSRGRTPGLLLMRRHTDQGVVEEEIALTDGARIAAPETAIEHVYHDRATGLWIGYTREGDVPTAQMFDPLVDRRVAAARKAFPDKTVRLESWSNDFSRMIVFTTGAEDAGSYWIVDIATGKADPVGDEYPTIGGANIGPIKMVEWKATDGTVLHGVLSLPPGRTPTKLPIVVMPHGGPEARDYPVFDWWAQAFVARGYAVFQPNFRGSSGYGQAFRDAGFGEWGRKMQTDVSDGLAELARQGVVDARRACIVGGSYGGYAALAGVTVQHGLYRCAVSVAGVSDPGDMIRYSDDRRGYSNAATRYWQKFMGPASGLEQISPVQQAGHADAPILLIHGKDDTVVPFDQSTERALKAANKPVEMVVMPSEDHWLSREATRILMLNSAVTFVERYNPAGAAAP